MQPRALSGRRVASFGASMDLLGSILAYFGTLTALIVAVLMAYDAFIYTPLDSVNPQHTLTVAAKPSSVKAASAAKASKIATPGARVAAVSHRAVAAKAAAQTEAAAERRAAHLRKEAARQKHMRWLAQQARTREWASRQAPAALGYADAPHEEFGQGFYQ